MSSREPDDPVVRRIGAVLVIEPGGGTIATGEPDALSDVVSFLRGAGGDAERFGAATVVAGFENAADAISAATDLHVRAPGAAGWRAGLHIEEVVMTADADATLPAIERATALAHVARAGTTAVPAQAVPALGQIRDAVIESLDHTDASPGTVCLVVPQPVVGRRYAVAVLAGTAALGVAATAAWLARDHLGRGDMHAVTLGVDPFRTSGGEASLDWIGPALRDGLSTQLSELSGARVFSQEFMDFLMTREHLSLIEVANRLGIEKILSGTVVLVGDTIRVEVRVVQVRTGVVEAAYLTSGSLQDFLALENDMIFGVIDKLDLVLSQDDRQRIAERRATDIDAHRRLLDAEGAPRANLMSPPGPLPVPPGSWLLPRLGPTVAYADEMERDVLAFLERYRQATEARNVAALADMYVALTPEQRTALQQYFTSVEDLRVGLAAIEVGVVGDEAVVNFTRTDDFVDAATQKRLHVSVRLTKTLRRVDGGWRFAGTR